MKELLQRLSAPTPDFFKGIIVKAIAIGAVGGVLVGLPAAVPFISFPPILTTIGGYMVAIGLVAGSVAKTAKVDVPKEDAAQ
jgi:hypothetical protein